MAKKSNEIAREIETRQETKIEKKQNGKRETKRRANAGTKMRIEDWREKDRLAGATRGRPPPALRA